MSMVFYSQGILLEYWVPQTVSFTHYLGVMKRLREKIRRKIPDLW